MRQSTLVALGTLLGLGCSAAPPIIPTKNMDRPTDMSFVCLAMPAGSNVLSGAPMSTCHRRGTFDPPIVTNGQRVLGTFAFVPNATGGELVVGDIDSGRLVDLGPLAPGFGMLPIGGDPEAMAASQDGCWVATANRTTCDFTLIDPARLLTGSFAQGNVHVTAATGGSGIQDSFRRVSVVTPSGRKILSATGELAFLPSPTTDATCQAGSTARAVATFPGCDMVALLDFSFDSGSATIASAYYVRPDLPGGVQAAGAEPVCPVDCGGADAGDGGAPTVDAAAGVDGGAGADGGVAGQPPLGSSTWRLQPLVLSPDGSRVYVASLYDSAVTSLDIGGAGLASPARLNLADSPRGVSRLRLNTDPYADGTQLPDGRLSQGQYLDARGKFLYAFAADDSVRVIDIDAAPVECDVNIITDAFTAAGTQPPSCFPVGTPGRRALAQGPGLRIPTFIFPDSPPPLARDLAFADLTPTSVDPNVQSLSGQFGFLLASNGHVYVINLAPSDQLTAATHSFRETRLVGEAARTPLAVSIAPQRSVLVADQAFATTVSFGAGSGPLISSIVRNDGTTQTIDWFGHPDQDALLSGSAWDVTWEGVVPQTARASGIVQSRGAGASSAGALSDSGADFCTSGVRVGDVLMFAGCTQDVECQPDNLFSCQVTVSGARGVCLPWDGTQTQDLTARCGRFLGSRMRYQITAATPTSLALDLKLDEVPKTSLNPCRVEVPGDCQQDPDHKGFQCIEVRPGDPRCVEPCTVDSDCRVGNVCETVPGLGSAPGKTGLCVEAPPLDATCFPQPMTAYSVRAGNSYLVFGSSLPMPRTGTVAPDGSCTVDTSANSQLVNRIPLSAPQCPDSFLAAAKASGGFVQDLSAHALPAGYNPCLYTGAEPDGAPSSGSVRAYFENPYLRFVLDNLDSYPGDLLSIHFEFQYGFIPLTVQVPPFEVQLTMPYRIFTGPTETPESPVRLNPPAALSYPYLYVVDQGRSVLTPGSHGQVLRINPREGSSEIATFDTVLSGATPFQLQ